MRAGPNPSNGTGDPDPNEPNMSSDPTRSSSQASSLANGRRGNGRRKALFVPGDRIAQRYTVLSIVAEGAMGAVYRVKDEELNETVALKVIRAHVARDPKNITRFKREIQLARKVTHPHVCRIFDIGVHAHPSDPEKGWFGDEIIFLTMEYLEGVSLQEFLARHGPFRTGQAWPLIRQIGGALKAAHEAGIVHGDFKPANVILVGHHPPWRAVVTDFGLARSIGIDPSESSAHSDSSDFVGTPEYMAPEQIARGKVSKATDIYAFGLMVYQMLTGAIPFSGDTPIQTGLARLSTKPVPLRSESSHVSRRWDRAVMRCLEQDPNRRFPDMVELLAALEPRRPAWWRWIWVSGFLAMALGLPFITMEFMGPGSVSPTPAVTIATAPKTAVLAFHNATADPKCDVYADWLRQVVFDFLVHADNIEAVPMERISRLSKEMGIPAANLIEPASSQKAAQNMEADWLIGGDLNVTERGDGESFDLQLTCVVFEPTPKRTIRNLSHGDLTGLAAQTISAVAEVLNLDVSPKHLADELRAPDQSDARKLFASGRQSLWQLDFESARRDLERAASMLPNDPMPRFWMALVWASMGERQAAFDTVEQVQVLAGSGRTDEARQAVLEHQFSSVVSEYRRHVASYDTVFRSFSSDAQPDQRIATWFPTDTAKILNILQDIESRIQVPSRSAPTQPPPSAPTPSAGPPAAVSTLEAPPVSATSLLGYAFLDEAQAWQELGRDEQAMALFRESLKRFEEVGDRSGEARTCYNLAALCLRRGDLDQTEDKIRNARAIWTDLGDRDGLNRADLLWAECARRRGALDEAWRMTQAVIARGPADPNATSTAWARLTRAEILRQRDQIGAAMEELDLAMDRLKLMNDLDGQANATLCRARLHAHGGAWQKAAEAARQAVVFFGRIDSVSGQSEALTVLVRALTELDQWEAAEAPARKLLDLSEKATDPVVPARAHLALGRVLYGRGKPSAARPHLEAAVSGFRRSGALLEAVRALEDLGTFYRDLGMYQLAGESLLDVWRFWQDRSDRDEAARVAANLGDVFYQAGGVQRHLGHWESARDAFSKSLVFFQRVQDARNVAVTYNLIAECFQNQGLFDEAGEALESAMTVWQQLDARDEMARQWLRMADFQLLRGNLRVAETQLKLALDLHAQRPNVSGQIEVLERLELVYQKSGDPRNAKIAERRRRDLARSRSSSQTSQ